MRKNVQISYRGARFELGQGPQFYGIWAAEAAHAQPLEWWPKTPAGWSGAWARFVTIETPGTIGPVGKAASVAVAPDRPVAGVVVVPDRPVAGGAGTDQPAAGVAGTDQPAAGVAGTDQATASGAGTDQPAVGGAGTGQPAAGAAASPNEPPAGRAYATPEPLSPTRSRLAGGLLAAGVGIGIASLFPSYLSGSSLASQAYLLVPHVIYLVAWAAAAVLIALGGSRLRLGALLAVGTSLVTFGLFFADAGEVMGHLATTGPGLALGLISWLACAAGSALAFEMSRRDGPAKPHRYELVSVITLVVAGLGAAIAFAPSWDSYLLRWDFGSTTRTLGNAFSNPAAVIVGDVAVMVAVVVVVTTAALWRPARHGGVLVIGAAIPLAAQAISAVLQIQVPTPPAFFNISQSEVVQFGLTITNGLTVMFWVFCGFVVTLALLAARMLIADRLMATGTYNNWLPGGGWTPAVAPHGGPGAGTAFGQTPAAAPAGVANWPFFAPNDAQTAGGQVPGHGYAAGGSQLPPSGAPAPDAGQIASGEATPAPGSTASGEATPAPGSTASGEATPAPGSTASDGDASGHAEPPAAT